MKARLLVVLSALLIGAGALVGVQFSSAEFTSQSEIEASVNAAPDWTPPTVTMDDPGTPVSGIVVLSATAADADSSVATVTLQRRPSGPGSWTTLCTANTSPYECSWNTTAIADGAYDLRAIATDAHANSTTSDVVSTEVLNAVSVLLDPIPTPTGGVVTLSATFYNSGGTPVSMRFQGYVAGMGWVDVPGCGALTGDSRTCYYDTTGVPDGVYDWRVVAVRAGTTYYDTQDDVRIDNTDPSVNLTVPGSPLTGNVNLTGTAGDGGGSGVASVTFQYKMSSSSTWLDCGVDNNSPYACTLDANGLAEGTYNFRATSTDHAGNTRTTNTTNRVVDHAAPTVSLTVPGGPLSGNVNLNATASDSMGIDSVAFQYRRAGTTTWQNQCNDNSAPYACTLNAGPLTDDTYEFQAIATDDSGRTTTTDLQSRMVDNDAPTVSVQLPSGYLSGNVTVSAHAADGNGIQSVDLQHRQGASPWITCATDDAAPFECTVDTAALANGQHQFRAIATDNANRSTTSTTQTATVDNIGPNVTVAVPGSGNLSNSVTYSATATDADSGVASVLFQYRQSGTGTWLDCGTDTNPGYTCAVDTTTLDEGNHDFRAVATDIAGNATVSDVVTRNVSNTLFGVDIQADNNNNGGRPASGDQMIFTYNRQVDPASIKAGWGGAGSTPVSVTMNGQNIPGGPQGGRDWISFGNANLGVVSFEQNYLNSGQVAFSGSTMTLSSVTVNGVTRSVVTVTLGNPGGTLRDEGNDTGTMLWVPSTTVTSATGSATPCSGAGVNEPGGNDADL